MQKNKQHIEKEEFLSEEMLLKYRQGELLPSEMRRVEALLEKYSLYADALEGYELLDAEKIRTNTAFLKASIRAQVPAKTIYLRQSRLMRVAAAIVFLLVCSFGIYFFANQSSSLQNEMAQATSVADEENKLATAPQTEEKAIEFPQKEVADEQPKITERKEIANNHTIKLKDEIEKITDREISKPENNASLSQAKISKDTIATPLALAEKEKPSQLDDKIVGEAEGVIPAKPQIISDITVAKSSPAAENRKMESELAEETASKKDKKREKKMTEKKTAQTSLPAREELINLLKKEILLFAKEKNETLKGKLLLTFSTSKEGVAENIVIKESPCLSCNELIIRLIKEFKNTSATSNKNEPNQTIEITF
ncbi:MAG: hypothetical protein EAZ08_03515 [Cytophagales bacterium]|nr:MAG: hypothetical protein EAZ08_03515 [Cytophagales bacterium]